MEDGIFVGFLFIFIGFAVFMFILGIAIYLLMAIGLVTIAKREGKEDISWLAWIPFANSFLMMVLLEGAVHKQIRGNLTLFYGILMALSVVAGSLIPLLGFLPALAALALYVYAFYYLANRYSNNAMVHLIIAIVTLGYSIGVQIFLFRNKEVVDPTGLDEQASSIEENPTE